VWSGEGACHLSSRLGVWGSVVSSPSGVRGGALVANDFSAFKAVFRQIAQYCLAIILSCFARQSLNVSLFISRLDYGSVTLAGLPACQLYRLQSVLYVAARVIYRSKKCDHVIPLLHNLHRNESRSSWRFWRTTVRMWRRLSHGEGFVQQRQLRFMVAEWLTHLATTLEVMGSCPRLGDISQIYLLESIQSLAQRDLKWSV